MTELIVWRLVQFPFILAVIFLITFALAWIAPGNPLEMPDRRPPPQIEEAMLRQYNLHSPWAFMQSYVWNVVTALDFGPSLRYRDRSVNDILASGLPVSYTLGVVAMGFALVIGFTAGILGALKPGSPLELASLGIAALGISLPSFVVGMILLVIFAGMLNWFPVGDWGTWRHVVLPALTLSAMPAAYIARLVRLGLADTLNSDYVRTARAKGASETRIVFRHALKVASLPVLSFLGPAAASVLTGSFVVEYVFTVPGMGRHFIEAVLNKDQFLILGVVLVYSTTLVTLNLIVDVAYAWLDPRIDVGA